MFFLSPSGLGRSLEVDAENVEHHAYLDPVSMSPQRGSSTMSGEQARETIELLLPLERYLSAGMHIGTHICTAYMRRFVYRVRPDGLYILDIRKTDERLRIAAKFLARFEPQKIVAVAVRQYAQKPVQKFCTYVGCKTVLGRIMPGTFTNPSLEWYLEPDVILVSDPRADSQAVDEAARMGIPVVALADTDNRIDNLDLIIPVNNKGRRSLALTYWVLAREILREQGKLRADQDLPEPPEAFEFRPRRRW